MCNDVVELINRYQSDAAALSRIVMRAYAVDNLFLAYRKEKIPAEGIVSGVSFRFHGCGCYFKSDLIRVDVDFGPGGIVDGFDAGRLIRYVQDNQIAINLDYSGMQEYLEALLSSGVLIKPGLAPSAHLFYFNPTKPVGEK